MVFFNYATMQMAAKIVYYGPGLCGKTTNLHHIYNKTSPQSRGEMVSLETETDRTLFFDLLPIDVGVIGGFRTRLQLYTVPGQVFYNTTRKLVLKGADGIVFVADSQPLMLDANIDSFRNLKENLAEIGLQLEEMPLVIQLNKRDIPTVLPKEEMLAALDTDARFEYQEAAALKGEGVFETLKLISKLTLRSLRKRMMGEDRATPAPSRGFYVQQPKPPEPARGIATDPARTLAGAPSFAIPVQPPLVEPREPEAVETAARVEVIEGDQVPDVVPPPVEIPEQPLAPGPEVDAEMIAGAPIAPLAEPAPEEHPVAEEIAPSRSPTDEGLKRVKVRSSVDIMAELEALRKKATQTPTRSRQETVPAETPSSRREMYRTLQLEAGGDSGTRQIRVQITFEDEAGNPVLTREGKVDVESLADVQRLMLNLRIDLESESS